MLKNVVSRLRFRNISCKGTCGFFLTSTPNQSFGVPVLQNSARRSGNETRDLLASVHTQYEEPAHTEYPETIDYSSRHQQRQLDASSDYDRVQELFFNKLDSKRSSIKAEDRFVGVGIDTLDGELFDTCREETCDHYRQDASIQAPRRIRRRRHETSSEADAGSTSADSGACGSATGAATCRQKLLSTLQILQNKEETLAVQAASLREAEERISKLSAKNQAQNEQIQKHQEELSTLRQNVQFSTVSGTNESFVMFGSCSQELDEHKKVIKYLQNNFSVIEELYKECFYESAKQEQLIEMLRQSYIDVRAMERSKEEEITKIKKMFRGGDGQWNFEELSSEVEKLKRDIHNFLTSSNGSSNNDSGMWERSEDGSSMITELGDDLRYIVAQLETLRDILAVDPCRPNKLAEENERNKIIIKELKKELDCKQKQLKEKEKKNELLQKFLEKNKETLCKLKQSGKLKKEKELSSQIKHMERELKCKRKTICEYEKILEEPVCDKRTIKYIEKLKETNKGKEEEIVCLRKRISELESLLEESDVGDSDGEDRIQSARSARACSTQSGKCNCGLAGKNQVLQEKCCNLEKQVCCLRKEVNCLRAKLSECEQELASREPADDTDNQCELEQLKCTNNCLMDENASLKKETECLRCEIEKLEEKICNLEQSKKKPKDKKGLKEENACLTKENECLRCMIDELKETICDLEKCTTARETNDEKCIKESYPSQKEKKLIEVCKSLETELAALRCRNEELEAQIREKECILQECQDEGQRKSKKECTCKKANKEIEMLRKKQETLHQKLCEAEALIAEKQKTICELQKRDGDRNDSDDETCLLKKQIDELNEIIKKKNDCIRELQCNKPRSNTPNECTCKKGNKEIEMLRKKQETLHQKLCEAEALIAEKQKTICELQKRDGDRSDSDDETCLLKKQIDELNEIIKKKNDCIRELQCNKPRSNTPNECRCGKSEELEELKDMNECYECEIATLNQQMRCLEDKLQEKDQRLKEFQEAQESKTRDTKCRCSKKNNSGPPPEDSNLKQRVCELELCLKDKERCIQEMQAKMDEKRIDCASKRESLKEKISCLENEICDLNAKIRDLQRQLCERDNCITERNEELRTCRDELCKLTRDAEELRRSVMEQCSVTALRKSLQEALDKLAERTREMEELQCQVNCYKQQESDSGGTRRKLEELERELEEKENDYRCILQEKERLIKDLKNQVCCIEQGSRASLEQQEQLTHKLKCAEEALKRKSEELRSMKDRCECQEISIKRLKEELSNADKVIMESKKLRSEVSYLTQQVCLWRDQLQQSQHTVRELKEQLQDAKEQYRQLEADYRCKEQSSCFLQRELEAVTARGAELCEETRRILTAVREWARHVQAHKMQLSQKIKEQANELVCLRRTLESVRDQPSRNREPSRVRARPSPTDLGSCSRTRAEDESDTGQCVIESEGQCVIESATEEESCVAQPRIRLLKRKTGHRSWCNRDMCDMMSADTSHRSPIPNAPVMYARNNNENTRRNERNVSHGELFERGETLRSVRDEGEKRWMRGKRQ